MTFYGFYYGLLFKKSLFQQFLFCFERPCVDINVWRRAWLDANSQSEREGRRSRDELALKRVNQPRNPLARLSRVLIDGRPYFPEKYVRRNSTYIQLLINFTPLKSILFQKKVLSFLIDRLRIDIYFGMRLNIQRLYAKYKLTIHSLHKVWTISYVIYNKLMYYGASDSF